MTLDAEPIDVIHSAFVGNAGRRNTKTQADRFTGQTDEPGFFSGRKPGRSATRTCRARTGASYAGPIPAYGPRLSCCPIQKKLCAPGFALAIAVVTS